MGSPENMICEIVGGGGGGGVSKNIDNVLFRHTISVLCNVIIVDYYV